MPTSTQPNGSPSDKPKKSRLEREIEEILQRAEKENPLPPPTPIRSRAKRPADGVVRNVNLSAVGASLRRWLDTAPLLVAFAAAIIGVLIRDVSPFLATIAALGAVVALFWPVAASFRAPRTGPKMWRGREYTTTSETPQTITRVQDWLRKKGILK